MRPLMLLAKLGISLPNICLHLIVMMAMLINDVILAHDNLVAMNMSDWRLFVGRGWFLIVNIIIMDYSMHMLFSCMLILSCARFRSRFHFFNSFTVAFRLIIKTA